MPSNKVKFNWFKNRDNWPFWYPGYIFWRAPIKATKHFWGNVCGYFRRGRLGWSYGDAWDIDMYLGHIIPQMLRHMAEQGISCPMDYVDQYPDDEDAHKAWHDDLIRIASLIEYANSDSMDYNAYRQKYWNEDMTTNDEWREQYYQEDRFICEKQHKSIKEAMTWLGEHWFDLWD